jgi:2OG-Fe(II) oxygenase superfamily
MIPAAPILVPKVLSEEDCAALIAEMVAEPPVPTPVLRAGRDNYEPAVRLSDSCNPIGPMRKKALISVEMSARAHWPHPPGRRSTISAAHYFRYPKGGFASPHRDRSPNNSDPREVRWRMATLVLFLNSAVSNDGFEGGSLVVYIPQLSGPTVARPIPAQAGTLALFEPGLVHEVTKVRSGERYTLVAWLIECE